MSSLFYTGAGDANPTGPKEIPTPDRSAAIDPSRYIADQGLIDAVNSALLLGQPLLLTGEAGTGKTAMAGSLAWELGYGKVLRFEAKSTSKSRDLYYTYDALGRFQAAQSGGTSNVLDYISYNALGKAILLANKPEQVHHVLPKSFEHPGRRRSVVLIDEVDKTPRDFPNDILTELEEMYFRITELNNQKIEAEASMQPVVVITSNSEKHLPDPFLRRCIFYHIPFPGAERLRKIIRARLGTLAGQSDDFINEALDLFHELRQESTALLKKPATAELIGWITALRRLDRESPNPLAEKPERALGTLSILIKTTADLKRARPIVEAWVERRK